MIKKPKSKKINSLRVTIALAFILLVVIILLISGSLNHFFRLQTQEKAIDSQNQLIASEAASEVKNFILDRFSELDAGVMFGNLGISNINEQELVLKKLLGYQPAFRQLVLLDPQGQELLKVSRLSSYATTQLTDIREDELFLEASKEERYISSVYIDNITNEPLVIIAISTTDIFGNFTGILMSEVNLKFMWDLVDSIEVGETGVAYVVDNDGKLIAFGDTSYVLRGEDLNQIDEVSEFTNGNEIVHVMESEISEGFLGVDVVTTHIHLESPDWAVVVELPVDEAYEDINQERVLSFLVIFLCLILAIIISMYLSKRITNPIIKLRDVTDNISKGNLDTKIGVKSKGEIGDLANSFEKMILDLKESRTKLEDYNKRLEVMVEERTKELAESKSQLEKNVEKLEKNKIVLLNLNSDLQKNINALEEAKKTILNKNLELENARKMLQELNVNLEEKVDKRTREVEKLLKQKDDFINQLGHDLKSPLNPLLNLIPLLESEEKDSRKKEIFKIINRNIDYMKNLVIKTINLAKLNSPKTQFNFENTNLFKEVSRIIENKKNLHKEKNFKLNNNISKDINIFADKLRFEELVNNLLDNSLKYTPGSGTIKIDAEKDENFVIVSIEDSGIGMDHDQIAHIFDEFYKADESRHDFESSGLGLSICKRIVEKHGGHIWADSKGPGKGSIFYFTLPMVRDEEMIKILN